MDGWTDGRTDERTDRQTDRYSLIHQNVMFLRGKIFDVMFFPFQAFCFIKIVLNLYLLTYSYDDIQILQHVFTL